jgi:hypothetical protein
MTRHILVSAIVGVLSAPVIAGAQSASQSRAGNAGAIQLAALQQAAVEADPRFRELRLYETQAELRLANIDAEKNSINQTYPHRRRSCQTASRCSSRPN